ncbi:hypothetical protein G6666_07570 [Polynucleobacter paneuropaeus]|nr:hypothetical protein [Polynucleobacter paneuropaeus]
MAQYRVLKQSFINGELFAEGAFVEYDGEVAENLELVKKGSKAAAAPEQEISEPSFSDVPTGV